MKRLHLLLPGSARPHPPRLATLLARGRALPAAAASQSEILAALFGLSGTPLAPLTLAGEGLEAGEGQWLRADPVHLRAGLQHVTVFDGRAFSLGQDEAGALVAALNAHFAGEIEFLAPHPLRWYARPRQPLEVTLPPLDRVAGGLLEPGLVQGADAGILHRLATEIQMLLHAQPVNDAREARGDLPINGVWFWGGGTRPRPSTKFIRLLADDPTARALAAAAGIDARPLPARFDSGALATGDNLAVLEAADDARAAAGLDAGWFGPLLAALQRGRLEALTLRCSGRDGAGWHLDRWAAWRLWRG